MQRDHVLGFQVGTQEGGNTVEFLQEVRCHLILLTGFHIHLDKWESATSARRRAERVGARIRYWRTPADLREFVKFVKFVKFVDLIDSESAVFIYR